MPKEHIEMNAKDPSSATESTAIVIPNRSPAATALRWGQWPAAFGLLAGISAAMKGTAPILGKMLLGAIAGGTLAIIFGGITFGIVYVIIKLK